MKDNRKYYFVMTSRISTGKWLLYGVSHRCKPLRHENRKRVTRAYCIANFNKATVRDAVAIGQQVIV